MDYVKLRADLTDVSVFIENNVLPTIRKDFFKTDITCFETGGAINVYDMKDSNFQYNVFSKRNEQHFF